MVNNHNIINLSHIINKIVYLNAKIGSLIFDEIM